MPKRPWTTGELRRLGELLQGGASLIDAAAALGRSLKATEPRALALRRQGRAPSPSARAVPAAGSSRRRVRSRQAAKERHRAAQAARVDALAVDYGQTVFEQRSAGRSWRTIAASLRWTAPTAKLVGEHWAKTWNLPLSAHPSVRHRLAQEAVAVADERDTADARACRRAHDEAMAACDARRFEDAWRLEERAAIAAGASEPSRGILYRSAAWCAVSAGRLDEAVRLARVGLAGDPATLPAAVVVELNEVLVHVSAEQGS